MTPATHSNEMERNYYRLVWDSRFDGSKTVLGYELIQRPAGRKRGGWEVVGKTKSLEEAERWVDEGAVK